MLNVMKKVVNFFIFITFLFGSLLSKFLAFTLPAKIYEKIKDIAKWAFQFYAFIKRQIALKSTIALPISIRYFIYQNQTSTHNIILHDSTIII